MNGKIGRIEVLAPNPPNGPILDDPETKEVIFRIWWNDEKNEAGIWDALIKMLSQKGFEVIETNCSPPGELVRYLGNKANYQRWVKAKRIQP